MFKIIIFNLNESVLNWFACSFCVIAENEQAFVDIFEKQKSASTPHSSCSSSVEKQQTMTDDIKARTILES